MIQLYNIILFQPLLNLLVWLYNMIGDIGVAIIIVTILIRFVLLPLSLKSMKSQQSLQGLQPKMDEIKNKFKDDKQKQSEELMKFYKENKINPMSSCLPLLVQLPIIFALYGVFQKGLQNSSMDLLYSFVSKPESINPMLFGLVSMTTPNLILAIIAGLLQFVQSWMVFSKQKKTSDKMAGMLGKQMTYFMPVMTVFIAMSLPAGLAIYWITTTLFAIAQQYIMTKKTGVSGVTAA
ncbi:MAG: YidC/Oxa1 family membrane protein insertase [Patescibacteria group bacterium]|jgi:YidC/Oxa1 family membrane protein insertase